MGRMVAVAGIALVVGILVGVGAVSLQHSAETPVARAIKEAEPVAGSIPNVPEVRAPHKVLKLASTVPTSAPLIGTMATETAERLASLSDGNIEFKLYEPKTVVPNDQLLDKVSDGAIDAVWASAGEFADRDSAFWFFSAVPFGPAADELLAWLDSGGGQELMDASFARFNIKPIVCAVLPPKSGGWFRREITSVDDLKGLKMRFKGLGARVIAKLGVETVAMSGGDTFYALQSGAIDAAEFSSPKVDLRFGFDKAAGYYYFPGWHQQSSLMTLLINAASWDALSDSQRDQITSICGDNIRKSLAEGEAEQIKALQEINAKGIAVQTWPPGVLEALQQAWHQVVKEEKAANPEFKTVWDSYEGFRKAYADWRRLGHLR
ncbi:MAG TPA: TRAP transporter substrate-binding protein [Ferrovibrio sp.]|uniref:TRAP transporter substrate-binding protein n=1 Tax=Ferrovibrio sp. TaxID=1917215 RepID=UPI002ED202FF